MVQGPQAIQPLDGLGRQQDAAVEAHEHPGRQEGPERVPRSSSNATRLTPADLDAILETHVIDPAILRSDDFESFYEAGSSSSSDESRLPWASRSLVSRASRCRRWKETIDYEGEAAPTKRSCPRRGRDHGGRTLCRGLAGLEVTRRAMPYYIIAVSVLCEVVHLLDKDIGSLLLSVPMLKGGIAENKESGSRDGEVVT